MTDFGPLLANPRTLLLGAAAQFGIFATVLGALTLNYFGIKVHKQKNLRAHAKLVMVDRERALVGSMNIDRSAFDLRRELGVTVDDPVIVDRLIETFTQDWESSRRYYAPDPLAPQEHDETDFPYDPELIHE